MRPSRHQSRAPCAAMDSALPRCRLRGQTCPGIPGIPPPIGGVIGGGGGGAGWGRYGLPTHAALAGICMHCVSSGPVGTGGKAGAVGGAYGLPWHWMASGIVAQRGSSGPLGTPGSGSAPAIGDAASAMKTAAPTADLTLRTPHGPTPTGRRGESLSVPTRRELSARPAFPAHPARRPGLGGRWRRRIGRSRGQRVRCRTGCEPGAAETEWRPWFGEGRRLFAGCRRGHPGRVARW